MTNPADDILKRIRQENERRLSVGNELANAIGARIEAEHLLQEAKDTEKKALVDAKKAGWTEAELNRITGNPSKRRSRKTASPRHTPAAEVDTSPAPSDGNAPQVN